MAGCIRRAPPPRGEGGSDTEEFAKSTTKTDKNGPGVTKTNSGQVTDNTTSDPNSAAARQKSIIQIYTDWANHYLERGRSKRYIQDLQNDVSDGVLLADVIEAVTGAKVPDINRKPKGANQMLENINSCLSFLGNLGVNTEEATAKDIKDGNLKTVLGLFFSLSRFKQAQKAAAAAAQVQQQQQINVTSVAQPKTNSETTSGNEMMLSKLPSPFKSPSSTGIGIGAHRSSGLPLSQAMAKGHSTSSLSLSNSGIPAPSSGGATNPVVQRRSYVNDRTPARNSFTPSTGIMDLGLPLGFLLPYDLRRSIMPIIGNTSSKDNNFRYVRSRRGTEMLLYQDELFYKYASTDNFCTHWRCSHFKLKCPSKVTILNGSIVRYPQNHVHSAKISAK